MGENLPPGHACFPFLGLVSFTLFGGISMLFSGLVVFLKATTRGHCGTEAAWLNQPGSRLSAWPPLVCIFEFIMVCFMVMVTMCEPYERRTVFSFPSKCSVRLYSLGIGLLCDLGPVS